MAGFFIKELKLFLLSVLLIVASAYSFVFLSSLLALMILILAVTTLLLCIDRVRTRIVFYESEHPTINHCAFCQREIINSHTHDSFCSSCSSLILLL